MENKIPESNNRSRDPSETSKLKSKTEDQVNPPNFFEQEEPVEKLVKKVGQTALVVNRLDYFANTIPLGAFCNSLAFILYGFYEAGVYSNSNFLLIVILLFGGVGQLTTGLLEYIKGRTFTTALYFLYGLYFLSLYLLSRNDINFFNEECKKIFYGAWACLSFPPVIGSIKTNLFYIIQTVVICAFFIVRCIGECKDVKVMKNKVSGILEIIGGFASLYISISQVINENFRMQIIPCIALQEENEIDFAKKRIKEE